MPCQASVDSKARDPLKPTKAPEEPWSTLYADHWGPTQDGLHLLVVIDGLTRYPEVAVVNGTGADDNIRAFADIFSRHGVPKRLHSDNGAPFNGKGSQGSRNSIFTQWAWGRPLRLQVAFGNLKS